jgi:hypothetical protein
MGHRNISIYDSCFKCSLEKILLKSINGRISCGLTLLYADLFVADINGCILITI